MNEEEITYSKQEVQIKEAFARSGAIRGNSPRTRERMRSAVIRACDFLTACGEPAPSAFAVSQIVYHILEEFTERTLGEARFDSDIKIMLPDTTPEEAEAAFQKIVADHNKTNTP